MSKFKIDLIGYQWFVCRSNGNAFSGPYKTSALAKSEVNKLNK